MKKLLSNNFSWGEGVRIIIIISNDMVLPMVLKIWLEDRIMFKTLEDYYDLNYGFQLHIIG